MTRLVNIKLERQGAQYPLDIGHDLLYGCGEWARQNLSTHVRKIAMFSNELVFSLYGKVVSKSLEDAGFEVFVWLMNDGEKYKNFESLKEGHHTLPERNYIRRGQPRQKKQIKLLTLHRHHRAGTLYRVAFELGSCSFSSFALGLRFAEYLSRQDLFKGFDYYRSGYVAILDNCRCSDSFQKYPM